MFYKIATSIVRGLFRIIYRVEVEGLDKIPADKEFIVAPNHLSNLDPPMLGVFLPLRMSYMAKEELFRIPIFGGLIKALGAFPVKRGGMDLAAIKTAVSLLKSGKCIMIFPEGKRSRTPGILSEGKQGAVMIAAKAGVGILPVGINASYKPWSKIKIQIGDLIEFSEYGEKKLSSEDMHKITKEMLMPQIACLSGAKLYGN